MLGDIAADGQCGMLVMEGCVDSGIDSVCTLQQGPLFLAIRPAKVLVSVSIGQHACGMFNYMHASPSRCMKRPATPMRTTPAVCSRSSCSHCRGIAADSQCSVLVMEGCIGSVVATQCSAVLCSAAVFLQ